jgi:hypothetical protein
VVTPWSSIGREWFMKLRSKHGKAMSLFMVGSLGVASCQTKKPKAGGADGDMGHGQHDMGMMDKGGEAKEPVKKMSQEEFKLALTQASTIVVIGDDEEEEGLGLAEEGAGKKEGMTKDQKIMAGTGAAVGGILAAVGIVAGVKVHKLNSGDFKKLRTALPEGFKGKSRFVSGKIDILNDSSEKVATLRKMTIAGKEQLVYRISSKNTDAGFVTEGNFIKDILDKNSGVLIVMKKNDNSSDKLVLLKENFDVEEMDGMDGFVVLKQKPKNLMDELIQQSGEGSPALQPVQRVQQNDQGLLD